MPFKPKDKNQYSVEYINKLASKILPTASFSVFDNPDTFCLNRLKTPHNFVLVNCDLERTGWIYFYQTMIESGVGGIKEHKFYFFDPDGLIQDKYDRQWSITPEANHQVSFYFCQSWIGFSNDEGIMLQNLSGAGVIELAKCIEKAPTILQKIIKIDNKSLTQATNKLHLSHVAEVIHFNLTISSNVKPLVALIMMYPDKTFEYSFEREEVTKGVLKRHKVLALPTPAPSPEPLRRVVICSKKPPLLAETVHESFLDFYTEDLDPDDLAEFKERRLKQSPPEILQHTSCVPIQSTQPSSQKKHIRRRFDFFRGEVDVLEGLNGPFEGDEFSLT